MDRIYQALLAIGYPDRGVDWLDLSRPETALLRPLEAGSFAVARDFPPVEATLI